MKVGELLEILKQLPPQAEVVIPVKSTLDTIGPTPSTKIHAVYNGFDWDSGTVQIWTDDVLVRFTPEQLEAFKVMQNEARMVRRSAWAEARNKGTDYNAAMHDTEKDVHPLFRVTKDK
ncbi:hypothetical protein ENKO_385 [Klebsiella phage fENko-Kae01]|nr:hypothetical protein [Klebsiella phage fENko-Kae01]